MNNSVLSQLLKVSLAISAKGLAPATGGNFSAKINSESFFITRSGADKTSLTETDFLKCHQDGTAIETELKPSAETLIHAALYKLDQSIGAVLHTHSVASTVLSRSVEQTVEFRGYEMQKSIRGNSTHDAVLSLPVLENTQDMSALHDYLLEHWSQFEHCPGFLLRGHGLYAWGVDCVEAKRHIEGFEFLLECALQEQLLNKR